MDKAGCEHKLEQLTGTFCQCTGLITACFTTSGELVCLKGSGGEELQFILTAGKEIAQKWYCASCCPLISLPPYGKFIAISVCRCGLDKGFLFTGPFCASSEISPNRRSSTIIPYLIQLFRNIQEGIMIECNIHYDSSVRGCCLHVQQALNYIDNNYNEPLTLQHIAGHLGLNRSYLSSLFCAQTGTTFCQWLNHIRIKQSKKKLKYSDKTIGEIALAVGYTSQSYFTSLFKKQVGLSPGAYRKDWFSCAEEPHSPAP